MIQSPPRKNRAIRFALALTLVVPMVAHSSWPETYHRLDTENGVILDSTQVPVVNTCLEPMKIEVDQANVTGGIATSWVGTACNLVGDGQNFHAYYKMPYWITCGNGVKYKGEGLWSDPNDFGAEGEVSYEGGCRRTRTETYKWHQFSGHAPVYVDTSNWTIRNMFFNYSQAYNGEREIGWRNGWKKIPIDQIKKDWLGKTVTLPEYKGGNKKLLRPVLFVHGLDMEFDDTWGVRSAVCELDTQTVRPRDGFVTKRRIDWKATNAPGVFHLSMDAVLHFDGTCQSGIKSNWESDWKNMISIDVSPSTAALDGGAWEEFAKANKPYVNFLKVENNLMNGEIAVWMPEESLPKLSLLGNGMRNGGVLFERIIDGQKYAQILLSFSIPISSIDWEHAKHAKEKQGDWANVDKSGIGPDPYGSGTGPDVISRMQRLQKQGKINENGIYFFNGYRWSADSGKMMQPLPWWNDAGAGFFLKEPGESWTLYQYLEGVLDYHYGFGWKKDPSQTVDIVCHSQGGISLREMLANASGSRPGSWGGIMPQGVANAANHIRKVVTVNTPHFGSVTTASLENVPPEFSDSHGQILRDSSRSDITLADVTIDPSMLSRAVVGSVSAWQTTGEVKDWFMETGDGEWYDGALSTVGVVTAPIWAPLAYLGGMAAGTTADFRFQAQGNWLEIKSIYATADWWGLEKKLTRIDKPIDIMHSRMFNGRRKGAHIGLATDRINKLAEKYPKLPDGRELELQTMHSTVSGLGDLVRTILSENLGDICDFSSDLQNASCYAFSKSFEYGWIADLLVDDVEIGLPLMGFLDKWQKGFLARTDIAVDDQSQKAVRKDGVWLPELHPEKFKDPRTYELRKFFTRGRFPDSLAPHGEMGVSFSKEFLGKRFEAKPSVIGAPRLGHDIYCALAPDCSELLELGGGVARMPAGVRSQYTLMGSDGQFHTSFMDTVTVTGNFKLGVMPSETDIVGYVVKTQASRVVATVQADPETGLRVSSRSGVTQVVPTGYSVRPRIERRGNRISVNVTTWAGQEIEHAFLIENISDTLVVGTLVPEATTPRPLLVGKFNVDTALRNPADETKVRLWFREARGKDVKYSKPRIVVENSGTKSVKGLEFFYTFRADPLNAPVLEAPAGAPWSLVSRGGDLWDLRYFDSSVVIPPGGVWPSAAMSSVALRMSNNAQWSVYKDPSNDRNFGAVLPNQKILVRDGSGEVLWGTHMDGDDPSRPGVRKVSAWTREAATATENNVSKPELEVRNDGNVPLRNLTAIWYVRLPVGKSGKLETWHLPDTKARLDSLGGGLWAIEWSLPRWIQPGEKIVGGSIGVHLPQWEAWDRKLSPSRIGADGQWVANPWVVVKDEDGKVIWGNFPPLTALALPQDTTSGYDSLPSDTMTPPAQIKLGVEMRDEAPWEVNAVKPRVRVTNLGKDTVHEFTISFPFQTERNLAAMSFLWFPGDHCGLSLKSDSAAVLKCQNLSIVPGAVWPDASGAVFGLYHTDWSTWDKSNDPAFSTLGATFAPAPSAVVVTP